MYLNCVVKNGKMVPRKRMACANNTVYVNNAEELGDDGTEGQGV